MKKLKIVFWLLVIGFMGLVFFQNQDYFLAKNSLRIDLWFQKYLIPETPNGLYFIAFFVIGLLIAYVYYLPERFRCSKNVRQLNAKIASLETAAAASRKATAPADPHPVVEPQVLAEVSGEKMPAPDVESASSDAADAGETEPPDRS